jgi:hypothetical protein
LKYAASGLLLATVLSGCFDFVEPDLAEAGAPAVLQTTLFLSDSGTMRAEALLVPSLTVEGLNRSVPDDTLRISGLALVPTSVRRNGTREYSLDTRLADPATFARPLRVSSPRVTGVSAVPPPIDWYTIERADPDTVETPAGQDLVLHMVVEPGQAQPAPDRRFWILELVGDSSSFRISASGAPPAALRVPSYWIPAHSGLLRAHLNYVLDGVYRPEPGDYIHTLQVNLRLRWYVRLQDPASP